MRIHSLAWIVFWLVPTVTFADAATTLPSANVHVIDPAGRPAAGAMAVLVPPGHSVEVKDGALFDDDPAFVRASADPHGDLNFATVPDNSLLVIIHPDGWAVQSDAKLDHAVTLTRWASLHGRRLINNKPAAACRIAVWSVQNETTPYDPQVPTAIFSSALVTNDAGDFKVQRICSGPASIADATVYRSEGNNTLDRPLIQVDLKPETVNSATLGGPGRSIHGRVVPPPELAGRDDWEYLHCIVWQHDVNLPATTVSVELQNAPLSKQAEWLEQVTRHQTDADRQQFEAQKQAAYQYGWAHTYPFDVRSDNTFTVDGVASGKYRLQIDLRSKRVGNQRGVTLAQAMVDVLLPEGEDDAPVELRRIVPQPGREPKTGYVAPDFDVPGLDDRPVRLSDYRGQIVLLDFWATWCGPCVAEMPNLKSVYERFGATNQIVMLGLTSDDRPDLPTAFVRSHDIRWRQAFLGGGENAVEKACGVSGIPSVWLIDREGKVIARDLRDEKTAAAIEKALGAK